MDPVYGSKADRLYCDSRFPYCKPVKANSLSFRDTGL